MLCPTLWSCWKISWKPFSDTSVTVVSFAATSLALSNICVSGEFLLAKTRTFRTVWSPEDITVAPKLSHYGWPKPFMFLRVQELAFWNQMLTKLSHDELFRILWALRTDIHTSSNISSIFIHPSLYTKIFTNAIIPSFAEFDVCRQSGSLLTLLGPIRKPEFA